jgi:hypothetical protein
MKNSKKKTTTHQNPETKHTDRHIDTHRKKRINLETRQNDKKISREQHNSKQKRKTQKLVPLIRVTILRTHRKSSPLSVLKKHNTKTHTDTKENYYSRYYILYTPGQKRSQ